MYKSDINFINNILTNALIVSQDLRKDFIPYLKETEKYVNDNNLILSNQQHIIGENKNLNSYNIIIYTETPFEHTKNLKKKLEKLSKEINPPKDIKPLPEFSFQVKLFHYEINLIIDSFLSIKFLNNLYIPYRDYVPNKILSELMYVTSIIKKPPIFLEDKNIKFNYFSPEIELIEIYRKLYSPQFFDEWDTLKLIQNKLYNIIKSDFDIDKSDKDTSDRLGTFDEVEVVKDSSSFKQVSQCYKTNKMSKEILELIKNTDNLLLIDSIDNSNCIVDCPRLQIITHMKQEDFEALIKNAVKRVYPREKIIFVDHYPRIPIDFRIKKTAGYFMTDNKRKLFIEFINSTQYSLLPYYKIIDNIKIAHPYVQLRFKYIDLWSISLLNLPHDKMKQMKLSKYLSIDTIYNLDIDIPTPNHYVGYYVDEDIAKKRLHIKNILEYKKEQEET